MTSGSTSWSAFWSTSWVPARVGRVAAVAVLVGLSSAACGAAPAAEPSAPLPRRARAIVGCGPIAPGPLAPEPLPVLADHLAVRGPRGMVFVPPRGGRAEDQSETQLRVPGDDGTAILLAATELYRGPGEDAEVSVRGWLGAGAESIERLDAEGLDVFFVTPPAPGDGALALVARSVVVSPDGTVQHLAFFVAEEIIAGGGLQPCTALARQVAGALRPGGRRLDTGGGRRVLSPGIAIDVPPGYVAVERRGPAFEVHYFYRLAPLGGAHGQLGIYLGREPTTHVREVLEMRTVGGALLGQSVSWSAWTTADHGRRVHHMEAMMEVPGGDGLFAHAFLVAEDPAQGAEMKAVAETLSLFGGEAP